MSYVTLQFQGLDGAPELLRKRFVMKGVEFLAGQDVDVSPEFASAVIGALPEGAFKLIKGVPAATVFQSPSVKHAAKAFAKTVEALHVDPTAALNGLPKVTEAARKLLAGKAEAAVEAIEAGKLDAELPGVAVVASVLGLDGVAKAATHRAQALALKE